MPTLFLVRPRVAPPTPLVGHVVAVPSVPTVAECAARGGEPAALEVQWREDQAGFWDTVGLADALVGVGRPERIVAVGLHDPTPWEEAFIAHIEDRLGRQVEHPAEPSGVLSPLASLLTDPLAVWPASLPSALAVVEGDDPGLVAVGVAQALRTELMARTLDEWPGFADDTLVLVPDSGGRVATWRRVLESHGLPVQVEQTTRLADTSFGRWLVAVASLAEWSEAPIDREVLRRVLLSPWCRLEHASRGDLRRLLRSLRRPRVDRETWAAHVQHFFAQRRDRAAADVDLDDAEREERLVEAQQRQVAVLELTRRLADLWREPNAWRRLRSLVGQRDADAMRALSRARAAGDQAAAEVTSCLRVLDQLVGQDSPSRPAEVLSEVLGASGVRSGALSDHGVRLQTWSTWDGRGARRVVLAGLEEGGWPRPPRPLARADRELHAALGGLDPIAELSRQARVAARALASAGERAWLAWSRTDDQGSRTFPGALIAGLATRLAQTTEDVAGLERWAVGPRRATDASVLPDARRPPVDPLAAHTLAPVVPSESEATRASLAVHRAAVDADRMVQSGRTASSPTPWSGLLGAPLLGPDDRVSPTALEVLGACPIQYVLSKELRAEEEEDAGVLLDAMESGSMVHQALADVAQAAETWEPGDPAALATVTQALDATISGQLRSAPSMSTGLLGATGGRWQRALTRQLEAEAGQGTGGLVASPAARELDAVDDATLAALAGVVNATAGKELRAWLEARAQVAAALDFLDRPDLNAISSKTALRAAWKKARGNVKSLLTNAALDDLHREGFSADARDCLREAVREKVKSKRAKAEKRLAAAVEADRTAVPRRVVGAEWSFGSTRREGADAASTDTPLVVELSDDRRLAIKGQVDRIDAAADRRDLAVVDYKSGKSKSAGALAKGFARGTDLQLAVYAEAVQALHPQAIGGAVVAGRLAFVRNQKEAGLWLEAGGAQWAPAGSDDPAADPQSSRDVLVAHLDHAHSRLTSGVLPLKPRHCPLQGDAGAYCSYQQVCGLDVDAAKQLEDPHPQPSFAQVLPPPDSSRRSSRPPQHPAGYQELRVSSSPPRAEVAEPEHQAAVQAARDVSQDVFLSAGAGSGKTTALVGRYVAALEAGAQPGEVLAITFTRKATAEMRSRVRQELRKTISEDADNRRRRGWVQALGAAPIWTLDALSSAIVRELGGDDATTVSTDARAWSARWLEGRLVEAADEAPMDPDLEVLLQAWPVSRVQKVVQATVLASSSERALPVLSGLTPPVLVEQWVADLTASQPGLETLEAELAALSTRVDAALAGAPEGNDPVMLESLQVALGSATPTGDQLQLGVVVPLWALGTASLSRVRSKMSDEVLALRDSWNRLKGRWGSTSEGPLANLAKALRRLENPEAIHRRLLDEATVTLAAMRLAHRWSVALRDAREEAGVLDYGDVLSRAVRLLEAPDLDLEHLRTHFGFRHLLVDELQDTNADQVRLVRALRDRLQDAGLTPTLFGVGDPKQSIYRFRGAEVDVFEALLSDGHERLTMCWRSAPPLTRSLDRLFEALLSTAGPGGEATDPGAAVPWEPLAPRTDTAGLPAIDLIRSSDADASADDEDGSEPIEPQDALIAARALTPFDRQVASHIARLMAANPSWTAAILCHSWGRARHWGEALSKCGVPAFVHGGRGLLETSEVRTVLHLLDALESGDDDLAWLGLLRGPMCGLSDAGLVCLRRGRGLAFQRGAADDPPTPAGPRNRLSSLRLGAHFSASAAIEALRSETGRPVAPEVAAALMSDEQRLTSLLDLWAAVSRDWGIVPLSHTVARAIHGSGLRAVLHDRGRRGGPVEAQAARRALVNLRTFENLVDAVSAEPGLLPGDAVRRLRALSESGDDPADGGVQLSTERSVAVTTVHQAKGLEWDLVVLPDLGRVAVKGRGGDLEPVRKPGQSEAWTVGSVVERADDVFQTERGLGGVLAHAATVAAERAENRRLFYVAATRAKERLVLGGPWPTGDAGEVDLELVKLRRKRAGEEAMGLRHAGSWYEDLVVTLGLDQPSGDATQPVIGRTWEVGRDVQWVTPSEDIPGLSSPAGSPPVDAEALARAVQVVPHQPWTRRNPSTEHRGAPAVDPVRVAPAAPAWSVPAPVSDPRTVGTLVHRALERWGFCGAPSAELAAAAVVDILGCSDGASTLAAWVVGLLEHLRASQPDLVDRLGAAARRGRLFHEVRLSLPDAARAARWDGLIDLLWQDGDGSWHLLDYKVTREDLTADDSGAAVELDLTERIRKNAPQVAAYARLLRSQLPQSAGVDTFGLWFVRDGVVARWSGDDA